MRKGDFDTGTLKFNGSMQYFREKKLLIRILPSEIQPSVKPQSNRPSKPFLKKNEAKFLS